MRCLIVPLGVKDPYSPFEGEQDTGSGSEFYDTPEEPEPSDEGSSEPDGSEDGSGVEPPAANFGDAFTGSSAPTFDGSGFDGSGFDGSGFDGSGGMGAPGEWGAPSTSGDGGGADSAESGSETSDGTGEGDGTGDESDGDGAGFLSSIASFFSGVGDTLSAIGGSIIGTTVGDPFMGGAIPAEVVREVENALISGEPLSPAMLDYLSQFGEVTTLSAPIEVGRLDSEEDGPDDEEPSPYDVLTPDGAGPDAILREADGAGPGIQASFEPPAMSDGRPEAQTAPDAPDLALARRLSGLYPGRPGSYTASDGTLVTSIADGSWMRFDPISLEGLSRGGPDDTPPPQEDIYDPDGNETPRLLKEKSADYPATADVQGSGRQLERLSYDDFGGDFGGGAADVNRLQADAFSPSLSAGARVLLGAPETGDASKAPETYYKLENGFSSGKPVAFLVEANPNDDDAWPGSVWAAGGLQKLMLDPVANGMPVIGTPTEGIGPVDNWARSVGLEGLDTQAPPPFASVLAYQLAHPSDPYGDAPATGSTSIEEIADLARQVSALHAAGGVQDADQPPVAANIGSGDGGGGAGPGTTDAFPGAGDTGRSAAADFGGNSTGERSMAGQFMQGVALEVGEHLQEFVMGELTNTLVGNPAADVDDIIHGRLPGGSLRDTIAALKRLTAAGEVGGPAGMFAEFLAMTPVGPLADAVREMREQWRYGKHADPEVTGRALANLAMAIAPFAGAIEGIGKGVGAAEAETATPASRYDRVQQYGRTPTRADRRALGAGPNEVVDHDPPLVQRYYEGDPMVGEKPGYQMTQEERAASAADRNRMRLQDADDSNRQGSEARSYSIKQKKKWGL